MPQWVTEGEGFLPLVGFFHLPILDLGGFLTFPFHLILLLSKPPSVAPPPPCSMTAFGCIALQIVVAGGVLLPPKGEI
ncbi:hypothetical protein RHMOL_Rhmol06G0257400 [Rhododendron molle]|uniref:Uncharacterized protein n=1 Tax=Rhododendron molle TaxID=49168 RepID=A0ACC0NH30_RHOML|nr:hypothetical protein RHMOL_Rhmol06G0257400 [Rhododendron molle]